MPHSTEQIEPAASSAPSQRETWRQRFAYHEAGHCVVCLALDLPLAGAEISANGGRTRPEKDAQDQATAIAALPEMARVMGRPPPQLFGKFRDQIILCLAGGVAEDMTFAAARDRYAESDQVEARARAELVTHSGRGASAFLEYCSQECKAILGQHWDGVELIAMGLLERGSLDGDQLRAVWLNSKRPACELDGEAVTS